jgi:hypothetical protein
VMDGPVFVCVACLIVLRVVQEDAEHLGLMSASARIAPS